MRPMPGYTAAAPSSSSIRSNWLYFATRSVLLGSTGLDLTGVQCHCQVGNGGILGLTGTVGGNSGITGLVCHLDGLQSLGYGSDLVQLDQNGVTTAKGDSLCQSLGVGYEEVVAD